MENLQETPEEKVFLDNLAEKCLSLMSEGSSLFDQWLSEPDRQKRDELAQKVRDADNEVRKAVTQLLRYRGPEDIC
jgi:predicted transcriptional regulator